VSLFLIIIYYLIYAVITLIEIDSNSGAPYHLGSTSEEFSAKVFRYFSGSRSMMIIMMRKWR
jgi:hypothetical protein